MIFNTDIVAVARISTANDNDTLMHDPCLAALWDIKPGKTCPFCGSPPGAECLGVGLNPDDAL